MASEAGNSDWDPRKYYDFSSLRKLGSVDVSMTQALRSFYLEDEGVHLAEPDEVVVRLSGAQSLKQVIDGFTPGFEKQRRMIEKSTGEPVSSLPGTLG